MDIRDRVMGDQPQDFLHKIASIVPGYEGYVDRERRRDADKILRTQLARQYVAQRERLTRVQQSLLSAHKLELIAQVDREVGALQRFIDRLSTATYGYSGLFDPIKVEADDLDQLYAFDMSLTSGVGQVSSAIDSIEAATGPGSGGTATLQEFPAAIGRLTEVLDDLNQRLNQRADLLTSGQRLPNNEYQGMVSNLTQPPASSQGGGGGMAPFPAGTPTTTGSEGTPTTALKTSATPPGDPPGDPAEQSLIDDDQSFVESPEGAPMGEKGTVAGAGPIGSGIQTASSPVDHPGAPAHDVAEGAEIAADRPATHIDVPDTLKPLGDEAQQ